MIACEFDTQSFEPRLFPSEKKHLPSSLFIMVFNRPPRIRYVIYGAVDRASKVNPELGVCNWDKRRGGRRKRRNGGKIDSNCS